MFRCKYCDQKFILDVLKGYYCTKSVICALGKQKSCRVGNSLSDYLYFFQYVTTKDLLDCIMVELLNYLSLTRKIRRTLKEKAYRKPKQMDKLDKENLSGANKAVHKIETILLERNGYFPAAIYPTTIDNEYKRLRQRQCVFLDKKRHKYRG